MKVALYATNTALGSSDLRGLKVQPSGPVDGLNSEVCLRKVGQGALSCFNCQVSFRARCTEIGVRRCQGYDEAFNARQPASST